MTKKVLIVDDSTFMRKRIKSKLTDLGYQIAGEARDGTEAVEKYSSLKPDLVTMDITMRGKDGISASKEILENDPEANIIMLTMLKDDKYRALADDVGIKGFLLKDELDKISELI